MMQENLEQFLSAAVAVVKEVGQLVKEGFYVTKIVDTKTAPWDLVTEYDSQAEQLIISKLSQQFPSHKFIGEETTGVQKVAPILTDAPSWIIDPIDGTTNYVHGFYEVCISIGLAIDKELVVGVVYNPITEQLFSAQKGHGAFLNSQRINVSKCTELSKSLVCLEVSLARIPRIRETILNRLRAVVSIAQGVRATGSAALTLCHVANGAIDAYQMEGLKCWDVAAGVVILREAGGIVLDTNGGPFQLMANRILTACTQPLANEFVNVIKEADTECTKS